MNIRSKSGWFFEKDSKHLERTYQLNMKDVEKLFVLAEDDEQWAKNVRQEAETYAENLRTGKPIDGLTILLRQLSVENTGGAIVQYPFGFYCTFPSKRHLFRGENQIYPHSESSLSRRCRDRNGMKRSKRDCELLHMLSNMRIIQFRKFIWQFDIIPQWEGKLSDINYKAMAQHYGFETFLLDLTNNVFNALFFATCKWEGDHFEPLSQKDIDRSEDTKYGVLYQVPDGCISFINDMTSMFKLRESFEKAKKRKLPSIVDNGLWDGVAYQIGLQPFYRSHTQSGYIYPMKNLGDIRSSGKFERMCFPQSVEFSRRIYDMMDGGKKIYPDEGITKAQDVIESIQHSFYFSEDDLLWAYELEESDKTVFPTIDSAREALISDEMSALIKDAYNVDAKIDIRNEEVKYTIEEEVKDYINLQYNDKDFLEPVGNMLFTKPEADAYRKNRYKQIFGEEMA